MLKNNKIRQIKEEDRLIKNQSIKESISKTRAKRKEQICRTFELKIQENKLNQKQKEALKMIFIEGKWIKNEMISFGKEHNIFEYELGDRVKVKNKQGEFVEKKLNYIGSQQIQSVVTQVLNDVKALSKSKSKGRKVGSLKFISDLNSIDLKQYGTTYKIKSKTKIKIQGIPKDIKVKGLDQLDKFVNYDLSNAKLIRKSSGYYVKITVYLNKEDINDHYIPETKIGIDMGVKNNITLSTGEKINISVKETERLKKLQRKMFKKEKSSNNRYKIKSLINKEYEKINNRKNDKSNKLFAYLKTFEHIYFQDENISSWKKKDSLANGSRKIHNSILGRIKNKLKNYDRAIMLNRFEATTQTCMICRKKNKLSLEDRIYSCSCGYKEDRDIHSAKMMISIGMERTELKPVETSSSTIKMASPSNSKNWSMNQEASKSLA